MLLLAIPFVFFFIYTLSFSIITVIRDYKKSKKSTSRDKLILGEILFIIIGTPLGFYRCDEFGSDIPFAKEHMPTIIFISIVSIVCFFITRYSKKKYVGFEKTILNVGLLQGILICLITSVHFALYLPLGIAFPIFGYELATPIISLFLLLNQLYFFNKKNEIHDKEQKTDLIKKTSFHLLIFCLLVFFEITIATSLGQENDSIIKAYTESEGFLFSKNNQPNPF